MTTSAVSCSILLFEAGFVPMTTSAVFAVQDLSGTTRKI